MAEPLRGMWLCIQKQLKTLVFGFETGDNPAANCLRGGFRVVRIGVLGLIHRCVAREGFGPMTSGRFPGHGGSPGNLFLGGKSIRQRLIHRHTDTRLLLRPERRIEMKSFRSKHWGSRKITARSDSFRTRDSRYRCVIRRRAARASTEEVKFGWMTNWLRRSMAPHFPRDASTTAHPLSSKS